MHYYFDKILLFAKSGCYNIPPSYEFLQVLSGVLRRRPTWLRHKMEKGRRAMPYKLNYYLLSFKICFSIFSLLSSRVGDGGMAGYCVGRYRLRRSDRPLYGSVV
jgi:hypothetical protein